MSYSIIFETKIVILPDDRILHLSLEGCNNDDEGRDRHDFRGKIYTQKEWEAYINRWLTEEGTGSFDLKIGSRYCEWADYGKHLRTMTNRATTWEELCEHRICNAKSYDGITYYPEVGEPVYYPADSEEIDGIVYGLIYGRIKGQYKPKRTILSQIEDIVNAIDDGKSVHFYISKKIK